MELGKIEEHYFSKREITSDIIGSFNIKDKAGDYYCTTLSLYHAFSVHHASGNFNVSVYLQRNNGSKKPKPYFSLSKMQKLYAEQGFDTDGGDVLLTPIYVYLTANQHIEDSANCFFESPITVSAQEFEDFGERRVTSYYDIIGVCLERIKPYNQYTRR